MTGAAPIPGGRRGGPAQPLGPASGSLCFQKFSKPRSFGIQVGASGVCGGLSSSCSVLGWVRILVSASRAVPALGARAAGGSGRG